MPRAAAGALHPNPTVELVHWPPESPQPHDFELLQVRYARPELPQPQARAARPELPQARFTRPGYDSYCSMGAWINATSATSMNGMVSPLTMSFTCLPV